MRAIHDMLRELGGTAQKQELVRMGATGYRLTAAVRRGEVFRARQGWYSIVPPFEPRLRAIRVGGRLTGLSALNDYGAWSPRSPLLHVSVPRTVSRLRMQHDRHVLRSSLTRDGVVLHYETPEVLASGDRYRVGLTHALEACILDETDEVAVAALDWAVRQESFDRLELVSLLSRLPLHKRGIGRLVDASSESYLESVARVRLSKAGFDVETQVDVDGRWRVDIVIAGWLALELDGEQFHAGRFEEDRARDLELTVRGYHVLRFSYRQVMGDWDRVVATIRAALTASRPAPSSGRLAKTQDGGARFSCPPRRSGAPKQRPRNFPEFGAVGE